MNLFLNLLGLSAFVFGLRSWRLVYRRGWRKVLPVFSLYILFYCLSTVPVFLLRVHSLAHPEQRIACLIYQYTNWAVYLISILFLIMVLYELLLHTIPNQGNIRRRSSALFASGPVALAAIGVLAFRSCFHVAYCCWIDPFLCVASHTGDLVVCGLIGLLILLKEIFGVYWGRSVWLIALGPLLFYALPIPGFLLVLTHPKWSQPFDVAIILSEFIWLVLWWLAVRKAPSASGTQPRAAAVPI